MSEQLIPGLVELWSLLAPRLGRACRLLGKASRPPEGVQVHTPDGTRVTGVLFVDRGEVVGMLGIKHSPRGYRDHSWRAESSSRHSSS